jgi:hypothetical protein
VNAPQYIQDLADSIEDYYYRKGYKKDLTEKIKKIEPDFDKWMSNEDLAKYYYEKLVEKQIEKGENNE